MRVSAAIKAVAKVLYEITHNQKDTKFYKLETTEKTKYYNDALLVLRAIEKVQN